MFVISQMLSAYSLIWFLSLTSVNPLPSQLTTMLSARPMDQVSLALPSSSNNDPDSIHLFASPDKRLATALDSSQLAALLVPGKDSPVLSWQNSQSPIHTGSPSAGNLLTIPDCDETGKLPPQVCCVCVHMSLPSR